jgi:hypothetical protein
MPAGPLAPAHQDSAVGFCSLEGSRKSASESTIPCQLRSNCALLCPGLTGSLLDWSRQYATIKAKTFSRRNVIIGVPIAAQYDSSPVTKQTMSLEPTCGPHVTKLSCATELRPPGLVLLFSPTESSPEYVPRTSSASTLCQISSAERLRLAVDRKIGLNRRGCGAGPIIVG